MTWIFGKFAIWALRSHYRLLRRRMHGQQRGPVLEAAHAALDRHFDAAWPETDD